MQTVLKGQQMTISTLFNKGRFNNPNFSPRILETTLVVINMTLTQVVQISLILVKTFRFAHLISRYPKVSSNFQAHQFKIWILSSLIHL